MATNYSPSAYFSPYYFAPLGVPGPAQAGPGPAGPTVGPIPYFSPEYFAAPYFAPLASSSPAVPSSVQSPAIGATPFFSPWYFATSYFAPLAPPVPRGGAVPSSVQSPAIGATPYISPSYFATSYFAPLAPPVPPGAAVPSSVQSPAIGATPFFSPSYFTTSYFAPLAPPVPGGAVVPPASIARVYRDVDAYEALLALLMGTNAFQMTMFATPLDRQSLGSAATPSATIQPDGWEEFDEVDPTTILRHVTFSVDLLVRADDPLSGFDQLTRLEAAAHDAVGGSDLGGGCLPALTRLRRGHYDQHSLYPEQSVRLDGEFTYMVGTTVTPPAAS